MHRIRNPGLIEKNSNGLLIIRESELTGYLAQIA
mgnify:CR=1 FL=1